MPLFLGDLAVGTMVSIPFSTHEAAGGNVAPSSAFEIADIRVYRGASATQRSSSSGMTMTSPFDSLTGVHMVEIDTSDDTDTGFFASGYLYHVMLAPDTETVDGQTLTGVHLASFGIEYGGAHWRLATIISNIGSPSNLGSGASVAANLVDIEGQTDDIGAAGAGLSAIPWNAAWDTEVQSEVEDGLVAKGLDHLLAASVTGTDVTDNSIIAKLVSKSATADWDSYVNTTDALEALRDNAGTNGASLSVGIKSSGITSSSFASGAITAAAIAADAIGASELAADAVLEIADGVLDEVVEGSTTLRQMMRLFMAALVNKASGGGTTSIALRDIADTKDRIALTVDSSGNRTAVTTDAT